MTIHVFLVEDHEIVRQGIRSLLDGEQGITVIGEAVDGEKALVALETLRPDVLLMDMNMPVMNGLECTREAKRRYPELKVLILSMLDHESYLIDMLEAGADGYILKNSSKDELLFAIRKIANNGIYMAPEFTLGMLAKYRMITRTGTEKPSSVKLSDREKDILVLIAEGLTNQEIADRLFSSVRTVETRRRKLLEKTGARNTAMLIRYAVKNGFVN
jgi:DNA-binding NarL/FixJ family response regulator